MNFLEKRILEEGTVEPGGIIKVDSFLNNKMDIGLLNEIGAEFGRIFAKKGLKK